MDPDLTGPGANREGAGIGILVVGAVHGHADAELVHPQQIAAGDFNQVRAGDPAHRIYRQWLPVDR